MSEVINRKTEEIKQMARGFKNRENFKTSFFFILVDWIYTRANP